MVTNFAPIDRERGGGDIKGIRLNIFSSQFIILILRF